jgi:enoyl-CoA hydratase/carnithine racemase
MLAVDDFTTIALSVELSRIARLELRLAERANAMDRTMAYELRPAAVALLHEPAVRAVLISSFEALEWGLVNELAEPEEVTSRAEALVASLAASATGALGGAKRVLYEGAHSSLEQAMERESLVIGQVAASPDARE